MITTNLIERRPRLRIAFSHGGGTLAMLLPRLEQARHMFPALREAVTASPTEQARKFYYDDLVFDALTLRHLAALFGTSRLLIGTDYLFNFHDQTPVARLVDAGLEPAAIQQILLSNAERLIRLVQGPLS